MSYITMVVCDWSPHVHRKIFLCVCVCVCACVCVRVCACVVQHQGSATSSVMWTTMFILKAPVKSFATEILMTFGMFLIPSVTLAP